MATNQQQMNMLKELLELDEGLTDYEVEFIENIKNRVGDNPRKFSYLSEKQTLFLENLWQQKFR
jgi:hypothetical protein